MILSNKATYAFFDKPISSFEVISNKIAYLTTNQLCIITLSDRPRKQILSIGNREIVSFSMNKNQYIAIIYYSWTLQIRQTSFGKMADVLYRFAGLSCKQAIQYPKIRWDNMQIYLVYNHKLQIFNIQKKQRKEYNQILNHQQTKNQHIFDLCASKLIQKQRVVVLQLKKKLIFSFIPIPVTQLQIESVIQILHLSPQKKESGFPREYLAVVTSQKLIKFYNFINMKQIYQMNYNAKLKKGQKIKIFTDPSQQYIHVCVHQTKHQKSQSLKPIKNYIIKINSDYYYGKTLEYFGQEQPFIKWQSEIPLKLELGLHSFKVSYMEGLSLVINLVSFGDGEINMLTYELDPRLVKFPTHGKWQDKQWRQVKEWKDIITSYMELSEQFIYRRSQQRQNKKSSQIKEKELKQYENIKSQFDCMMKKFTETFDLRQIIQENIHQEDPQIKIEEEWTKYFQNYLIDNNFHLNPQGLQKIDDQSQQSDQCQQTVGFINLKTLGNRLHCKDQQGGEQQEQGLSQHHRNIQKSSKSEIHDKNIIFDLQTTLQSYNKKQEVDQESEYQKQRQENLKQIVQQRQKIWKRFQKQKKQRQELQEQITQKRKAQLQPIIRQYMKQYESIKGQYHGDIQDFLMQKYKEIQNQQEQQRKQVQLEKQLEKQLKKTKQKIIIKQEEYAKVQQRQLEQKNERINQILRNTSSREMGIQPKLQKKQQYQIKENACNYSQKQQIKQISGFNYQYKQQKTQNNKTKMLSLSKQLEFCKKQSQIIKFDFGCQVQQVELLFLKQEESGNQFFKDQPQFYTKVRELENSICKAFKPFQQKVSNLQKKLDVIQNVHIYKLKKCQYIVQKTNKQNQHIDLSIKSYFREMLSQITIGIKQNLMQFQKKAEQSNQKVVNQRKQTVKLFQSYVAQQIKHRSQIFESSRNTIQNHLIKIRRKIISGEFNKAIERRQKQKSGASLGKTHINQDSSQQFQAQDQYIQRLLNENDQIPSKIYRKS